MKQKIFGDFQTPQSLAHRVVSFLSSYLSKEPDVIIEPTAGLGNFIDEASQQWGSSTEYYGFDINSDYVEHMKNRFSNHNNIIIQNEDFFTYSWNSLKEKCTNKHCLILGNPPWVTNSMLGSLGSNNLPEKRNFQGLQGFEAKTGKANFDIAEWIIIKMVEEWGDSQATLAMLCKTSTARKTLRYFWKENSLHIKSSVFLFDAKKEFDVAVDACLLVIEMNAKNSEKYATIFSDVSAQHPLNKFGLLNNELIADIDNYQHYKEIDGKSSILWRSGIKHDATKVMELTIKDGDLYNGFNEVVDIEPTYLYPLLKSSDIGNGRLVPRKYVIATQKKVGEDTEHIQNDAPKTWAYLTKYQNILDARKSSIYKKKAKFSIFGIGDYSYAPWKIAISGMYKNIQFQLLAPYKDKPIMVDDTCYFLYFENEDEARKTYQLLTSKKCIGFLKSLIFFDAKRPVNIDILNRINLNVLDCNTHKDNIHYHKNKVSLLYI